MWKVSVRPGPIQPSALPARTGVSERSLRYYEQQGILAAGRTPGGQREYPEEAANRVIRIQELFAAGLNSRKIGRGLLPCMRDSDGGPSEIATPALVADLTAERNRIDRMITELINSRDVLNEVIERRIGPHRLGHGRRPSEFRWLRPVPGRPADDVKALFLCDAGEIVCL